MLPLDRVREFFAQIPSPPEIIILEQNTSTAALAAEALGVEVGQIAKTLVFTGKKEQAVVVVTCGDVKVDIKKLKKVVGFKPKFASSTEVEVLTGFSPGGVCPFALLKPLPVFLDVSMKRFPLVYAAAGTPNSAVPIDFSRLLTLTDGQVCDVCSS
ncbi:MAG: YbaK/EbsC family protein [Peptococcia bacterium]|jgi:Cys-tRNA(Pro) deacylase